jgi:hypothetical protein
MGSADDQQLSCLLTVLFVNGNDKVRLKFAAFNFFCTFLWDADRGRALAHSNVQWSSCRVSGLSTAESGMLTTNKGQ